MAHKVENAAKIKQKNMNRLWHLLRQVDHATVSQLAKWSGLSVVTTTALTKELLQRGQIEQDSIIQPQLGRPAVAYRFAAEYKLILLIYTIEHDQLDYVYFSVCNLRGDSIYSLKQPLPTPMINSFDETIKSLIGKFPLISCIGLGLPVGSEFQDKLIASDYPFLQDMPLRSHLSECFGLPVIIENDINAAAYGYCHSHHLETKCLVSVFFPNKYTPGAGIYLNGQLVKGQNGLAGACQYLPFGEDWQACRDEPHAQCEIVIRLIRIFTYLLNPHVIVLYWDRPAPNIMELLQRTCHCKAERVMLPSLVISDQMLSDFQTGLTQLTLHTFFQSISQ